jgi:hypothetical protein
VKNNYKKQRVIADYNILSTKIFEVNLYFKPGMVPKSKLNIYIYVYIYKYKNKYTKKKKRILPQKWQNASNWSTL